MDRFSTSLWIARFSKADQNLIKGGYEFVVRNVAHKKVSYLVQLKKNGILIEIIFVSAGGHYILDSFGNDAILSHLALILSFLILYD